MAQAILMYTGGISGGDGGDELNFDVIGGTTEPSSPIENTIWVQTENNIPFWAFSVDEPDTAEENSVWIKTSNSSSFRFDALKENSLIVGIDGVYVNKSGNWEEVSWLIYKDGEWQGSTLYVIKDGRYTDEFSSGSTAISGFIFADKSIGGPYQGSLSQTLQNGYMQFAPDYSGVHGASRVINVPVDVGKYNTLCFDNSHTVGQGTTMYVSINLCSPKPTDYTTVNTYSKRLAYETWRVSKARTVNRVNISTLTGNDYIVISVYNNGPGSTDTTKLNVFNLWFE